MLQQKRLVSFPETVGPFPLPNRTPVLIQTAILFWEAICFGKADSISSPQGKRWLGLTKIAVHSSGQWLEWWWNVTGFWVKWGQDWWRVWKMGFPNNTRSYCERPSLHRPYILHRLGNATAALGILLWILKYLVFNLNELKCVFSVTCSQTDTCSEIKSFKIILNDCHFLFVCSMECTTHSWINSVGSIPDC